MKFHEIVEENYFPEDDEQRVAKLSDTRRPRLSLKQLKRLRQIRELEKMEKQKHNDFVQIMYNVPSSDDSGF